MIENTKIIYETIDMDCPMLDVDPIIINEMKRRLQDEAKIKVVNENVRASTSCRVDWTKRYGND